MEKVPNSEKAELKELLTNIYKNTKIRIYIFSGFLLLSLSLKWWGLPIPNLAIIGIAFLLFFTFFHEFLFKKTKIKNTVTGVSITYTVFQIIEVLILFLILHVWGALLIGGITAFMIYAMFCYLAFTRRIYPWIITIFITIGYFLLGLLEHLAILPPGDFHNFNMAVKVQDQCFFITNITFFISLFICLILYMDIFSKKLRDSISVLRIRTHDLGQKEKELSEAKSILEVKVRARTKELETEKASLEKKVKERTKELQERVNELERFHKLTIGRELKMVELKKEIEKLKKEQKNKLT